MDLQFILVLGQIAVSVILIILILLQDPSDTGGVFGGGADFSGIYQTRRGLEKLFFRVTVIFTILFVALAILNLVLPNLQNLL